MNLIKNVRAIKRNIKRFYKSSFFRAKFTYTKYYETLAIDSYAFLIQSYSGTSISGNPFYFLEELCNNIKYKSYKKYVAVTASEYREVKKFLDGHNFTNVVLVKLHTRKYCKILASAKYLINNVTFPHYFIKREEQIYLNTWHGTPLKGLGKFMPEDMLTIGNVQRNFFMSDYILLPNQFTIDIINRDYMLEKLYNGKFVLTGYPRNNVFYDLDRQKKIKEKEKLKDKKIYVYMPTWRGTHALRDDTELFYYIMHMLIELDKNLDDNSILYVKEHNMSSLEIDFEQFEHVEKFPSKYETYEFLSIADCLITDYSSVMFDYANTGRKIILYAYDQDDYLKNRGMYIDFNSLPFEKVYTTKDLITSVINIDSYNSYEEDVQKYIEFDKNKSIEDVLEYLLHNNESEKLNVQCNKKNILETKKNTLIFTGALHKNGITSALKGVLYNAKKEDKNFVLTFYARQVKPNRQTVAMLSKDFDYICIQGECNYKFSELLSVFLYFRLNISNKYIMKKIEKVFKRESQRIYPNIKFDYLIHYTGYERKIMNLFSYMTGKKMIYVHNNLIKEHKSKNNIHMPSLISCYNNFDKIVIIRESMREELLGSLKSDEKDKVFLAHNLNNYNSILELANEKIEFDEDTISTVDESKLTDILQNPTITKFINIARFSKEKGLDNLIKAFEIYHANHRDSYMIIIGGYGPTYEEVLNLATKSICSDSICIIQSISNPYPILKMSNAFILSSHYEGLPMVIMEALILNKPVISTSISGPKEFLEQGYGYLVPDSIDGLVEGMNKYTDTHLSDAKRFDYVAFNENAISEFENLFD